MPIRYRVGAAPGCTELTPTNQLAAEACLVPGRPEQLQRLVRGMARTADNRFVVLRLRVL